MSYVYAGQYGAEQMVNSSGAPLSNTAITVYTHGTTTLATLYTDRTKATQAANPVTTDSVGNLIFWADPGQYDLTVSGLPTTNTVLVPLDPSETSVVSSTAVGGDVSGTISAETVAKIEGFALASTTPTSNQALVWDSGTSKWTPTAVANSFNGRTGAVVPASGDYTAADVGALASTAAAGGDLSGNYPNPTVAKIQGTAVSSTAPTKSQVLIYTGTDWTPETQVFDVKAYGAKGDGTTDDTTDIQAADTAAAVSGGIVYFPPGVYIAEGLTPSSTTHWVGAGQGATTLKLKSGSSSDLITKTVASGGSFTDWSLAGITLDGNSTTTQHLLTVDTSANSNITYNNLSVRDCTFQNAFVGIYHVANNASSGATTNGFDCGHCRFENNSYGYAFGGSYGEQVHDCYFAGNTLWAICVPGSWEVSLTGGSGPTAAPILTNLHIEGLGVFDGTGTDSGLGVGASAGTCSDVYVSNVSKYAFSWVAGEGFGTTITNLNTWGCGGGLHLGAGASLAFGGEVVNFSLNQCGRNTHLGVFQYPINIGEGNWTLIGGTVNNYTGITPAYGIGLGEDGGGSSVGECHVKDVQFPSFGTGLFEYNSGSITGPLVIKDCPGYNPVGVVTVTVPASGTAVTAEPYDRTFYVTTASGTTSCTLAVQSGPTVTAIASTAQVLSVFVPAGKTMTPTYAGTAPTWVVEGN